MEEIKSGILAGVEISKEKAKTVNELAQKLEELDNGVIDPEEETLAELMGAEKKAKDYVDSVDVVPEGLGEKVAEKGILTGVDVSEETAEELEEVAETLENLVDYEKEVNAGNSKRKDNDINNIGETLAVAMGVEPAAKTLDQR